MKRFTLGALFILLISGVSCSENEMSDTRGQKVVMTSNNVEDSTIEALRAAGISESDINNNNLINNHVSMYLGEASQMENEAELQKPGQLYQYLSYSLCYMGYQVNSTGTGLQVLNECVSLPANSQCVSANQLLSKFNQDVSRYLNMQSSYGHNLGRAYERYLQDKDVKKYLNAIASGYKRVLISGLSLPKPCESKEVTLQAVIRFKGNFSGNIIPRGTFTVTSPSVFKSVPVVGYQVPLDITTKTGETLQFAFIPDENFKVLGVSPKSFTLPIGGDIPNGLGIDIELEPVLEKCTIPGTQTVGVLEHRIRYESAAVPFGKSCISEPQERCNANGYFGAWTGKYIYVSCSVIPD